MALREKSLGEKWTDEEIAAEVQSWTDDRLQAMAFTVLRGRHGLALLFEPAIAEEFKRRNLEPAHSAHKTKCIACDGKAIYRVGGSVFCFKHKHLAIDRKDLCNRLYLARTKERSEYFDRIERNRRLEDVGRRLGFCRKKRR